MYQLCRFGMRSDLDLSPRFSTVPTTQAPWILAEHSSDLVGCHVMQSASWWWPKSRQSKCKGRYSHIKHKVWFKPITTSASLLWISHLVCLQKVRWTDLRVVHFLLPMDTEHKLVLLPTQTLFKPQLVTNDSHFSYCAWLFLQLFGALCYLRVKCNQVSWNTGNRLCLYTYQI